MNIKIVVAALISGVGLVLTVIASAAPPSETSFDVENARYAQTMLDEGRKTFRYETFGSEAFWGDTLQLHKAIAGEKNGGVGPGVSPKTALSVGLKVDADALPDALKKQLAAGKVEPRRSGDDDRSSLTLSSVSLPLPTRTAASSRWASSARFVTQPSTIR